MRVARYGHDARQPPRQAAEFRFLVADTSLQSPFSIYPGAFPDRFGFPCAPNTVRTHISGRKPLRFAAIPQSAINHSEELAAAAPTAHDRSPGGLARPVTVTSAFPVPATAHTVIASPCDSAPSSPNRRTPVSRPGRERPAARPPQP